MTSLITHIGRSDDVGHGPQGSRCPSPPNTTPAGGSSSLLTTAMPYWVHRRPRGAAGAFLFAIYTDGVRVHDDQGGSQWEGYPDGDAPEHTADLVDGAARWGLTEDGIPEVARRARVGQKMKGIARIYDYATPVMLGRIIQAWEARWMGSRCSDASRAKSVGVVVSTPAGHRRPASRSAGPEVDRHLTIETPSS